MSGTKRTAEWAADRARKYQKKALQLNYMAQDKEIKGVMTDHPETIPQLRNMLVDMG